MKEEQSLSNRIMPNLTSVLPHDEGFRQVVAQTDLDIKLLQQPPNSPDLNVLDLCFFRSLQSLTDTRAPNNIRELIHGVEEEYRNYEVNKLSRSFITLQSCMIGVMNQRGGIGHDILHMNKDQLEAQGNLGIALNYLGEPTYNNPRPHTSSRGGN
jgi:hypothetical protein